LLYTLYLHDALPIYVLDNLHASTSYTYTKSEQKSGDFKGQPLNKMPKHMINVGLDYTISDVWSMWADYNYRGKTSDYLGRDIIEDRKSTRLNSSHVK